MKTVNSSEIKSRLGRYLQMAAVEPVIIEKTHRPFAVLMSFDEYERLKRLDLENEFWGKKALLAEAEGYIGESDSLKFIQAAAGVET